MKLVAVCFDALPVKRDELPQHEPRKVRRPGERDARNCPHRIQVGVTSEAERSSDATAGRILDVAEHLCGMRELVAGIKRQDVRRGALRSRSEAVGSRVRGWEAWMPLEDDVHLPRDPIAACFRMREKRQHIAGIGFVLGRRGAIARWLRLGGRIRRRVRERLRRELFRLCVLSERTDRSGKRHHERTDGSEPNLEEESTHLPAEERLDKGASPDRAVEHRKARRLY